MIQAFKFTTLEEAEAFVTDGYPKYGTDLNGNLVMDKGVTLRAADVIKHLERDEWYVIDDSIFEGREGEKMEIELSEFTPPTAEKPEGA